MLINTPMRGTAAWRMCTTLGCTAAIVFGVEAAPLREPVQSLKPLLIAAIERGEAHGVLVGPAADAIANQFATREPIDVDVVVVGSLPTPGCKRLQVDTRQAKVRDRERATQPGVSGKPLPPKAMLLRYNISFCADGTFPPPAVRASGASAPMAAPGGTK